MQAGNFHLFRKKLVRRARKLASNTNDARRKLTWRLANGMSEETVPVFIVGAQRSGTTMLGDCLGRNPAVENLGESDPRAFEKYFLFDDDTISRLLLQCPYRTMIFKPLKDSCRVAELLSINPHGKSIWAYRNYADRINSAVEHFGSHPLDVFNRFKRGQSIAWQLLGLSADNKKLLLELDIDRLSLHDGAALMWYIRNSLFFDQELEKDKRVHLWSYDKFVTNPAADLTALTDFLCIQNHPYMSSNVHSRSIGKRSRPSIDAQIEDLCESLLERLNQCFAISVITEPDSRSAVRDDCGSFRSSQK